MIIQGDIGDEVLIRATIEEIKVNASDIIYGIRLPDAPTLMHMIKIDDIVLFKKRKEELDGIKRSSKTTDIY